MKTYGETRQHARNEQFLTNRSGNYKGTSRKLAAARRRDKSILHKIARRTSKNLTRNEN